jgi:hypothetical protein
LAENFSSLLEAGALNSPEFNGVLASWKEKVRSVKSSEESTAAVKPPVAPAELTIGQLIGGLKAGQMWSLLVALAAVLAGAFALGGRFTGK